MSKYRPTFGPYLELHTIKGEYVTVLKQQSSYNCGKSASENSEKHSITVIHEEGDINAFDPLNTETVGTPNGLISQLKEIDLRLPDISKFRAMISNRSSKQTPSSPKTQRHPNSRKRKQNYLAQLKMVTVLLTLAFCGGFFQQQFQRKPNIKQQNLERTTKTIVTKSEAPVIETESPKEQIEVVEVNRVAEVPKNVVSNRVAEKPKPPPPPRGFNLPERLGQIPRPKSNNTNDANVPALDIEQMLRHHVDTNNPNRFDEIPEDLPPPKSKEESTIELIELFEQLDPNRLPEGALEEFEKVLNSRE